MGLYSPINNWNIGGVMRAAHCYGVDLMAIQGGKNHSIRSAATDVSDAWKHIPVIRTDNLFNIVPYSCVPVAIEIVNGAKNLIDYVHPERAFYIFGPENGSLPAKILDRCRDIVKVPTNICMNLAAVSNVILYDRLQKRKVKRCKITM